MTPPIDVSFNAKATYCRFLVRGRDSPSTEMRAAPLAGERPEDALCGSLNGRGHGRLRNAHRDYWATKEGQAVLDFVADRPEATFRALAAAIEFYGHRPPSGNPD
jgi:hypothetical protein